MGKAVLIGLAVGAVTWLVLFFAGASVIASLAAAGAFAAMTVSAFVETGWEHDDYEC